jgi:hypothetical protein
MGHYDYVVLPDLGGPWAKAQGWASARGNYRAQTEQGSFEELFQLMVDAMDLVKPGGYGIFDKIRMQDEMKRCIADKRVEEFELRQHFNPDGKLVVVLRKPPRRTQYAPAKHDPPTPRRTPNAPKKTQPEARRQPPQATHGPPTPRNPSPAATAEPAVRRSNATKKATPSFTAQYYTVERAQRVLAEKIEDDPYFSGIDWEHMSEHELIKCKEFYAARRSRLIRFMDNSPATRQLQREFTTAIAASSEQMSMYKLILEAGEDFAGFNQRV